MAVIACRKNTRVGRMTYLVGHVGTKPVLLGTFPLNYDHDQRALQESRREFGASDLGYDKPYHTDAWGLKQVGL